MPPRVILYELNEVPWPVIDTYIAARPGSHLAAMVDEAATATTVCDDPDTLVGPWRSWPSLHTSTWVADHNSWDQGQDPASFRGTPIWDVVDRAGRVPGVFGALQSWPARPFTAGGFFVPDSFARTPETHPPELTRFQAFNTAMTSTNSFASSALLSEPATLARGAVDMVQHGLRVDSAMALALHLARERRDARYRSRRPVAQVLPAFDLYWRLHRRTRPDLSIFFSNHVASMMHRFWGDWMPGYREQHDYQPDPVHRTHIPSALDLFDRQLGRIARWMRSRPGTTFVFASSMGQGGVDHTPMTATYVLEHPDRLIAGLDLDGARTGIAMYPRVTLLFPGPAGADVARERLGRVTAEGVPVFRDFRRQGDGLSFEVRPEYTRSSLPETLAWAGPAGEPRTGPTGELGLAARSRPAGGNTAQHTPEGALWAVGAGVRRNRRRPQVSLLDVAPSLLEIMGLEPAEDMQGSPGALTAPAAARTSAS